MKHDLMNAMSSTCWATFGYFSQTQAPDSPYCRNANGDFISGPGLPLKTSIAIFLPWFLSSSGLGSNRSTALGAPSMNSQMTEVALGAKCGGTRRERVARSALVVGRRCGLAEQVRQRAEPQPRPRPGQEFPARPGKCVSTAALMLVSRHR